MMSLCQSVRYALGIYAISFLLNGISSTEDAQVGEQYTTEFKAIEPEGKTRQYCTCKRFLYEFFVVHIISWFSTDPVALHIT